MCCFTGKRHHLRPTRGFRAFKLWFDPVGRCELTGRHHGQYTYVPGDRDAAGWWHTDAPAPENPFGFYAYTRLVRAGRPSTYAPITAVVELRGTAIAGRKKATGFAPAEPAGFRAAELRLVRLIVHKRYLLPWRTLATGLPISAAQVAASLRAQYGVPTRIEHRKK